MKIVAMKKWFWLNKKMDLYEAYHCQSLAISGEVVGETEKAYKISVLAFFIKNEKYITVWAPKSACIEIEAA